jgi:hypothetical protein
MLSTVFGWWLCWGLGIPAPFLDIIS